MFTPVRKKGESKPEGRTDKRLLEALACPGKGSFLSEEWR